MRGTFQLPASKSISNRALILRALAGGGLIENLSDAHDTQLLDRLLREASKAAVLDCEDAGTTLRFLTAYCVVKNRQCVITGTARMCERPIGPLVEALRELGAEIEYLGRVGYPPLRLRGFQYSGQTTVTMRADISSQFISALMLIAPTLPNGLAIQFEGVLTSAPYLRLTAFQLAEWGAHNITLHPRYVRVPAARLQPARVAVEPDWSSAAFAYELMALNHGAQDSELFLPNLRSDSRQGDRRIADWVALFGLRTETGDGGVWLRWGDWAPEAPSFDFADCPDLAPPFIALLAGLRADASFEGLHSLRLKESDRLAALQAELARFGTELLDIGPGEAHLVGRGKGLLDVDGQTIDTYHDHRIAMAFAPLAVYGPLTIRDPGVVRKSFPNYWNALIELGFEVEFENEEP